jgi:hypothetical protein
VHQRLHGDIAPIVIVVTAAGGAIYLSADLVADLRHTLRHRRKPGEQLFLSLGTKIDVAGLWTPGANLTRQFDLDGYFINGSRDAVAMEIAGKAIGSDPHIASLPGRAELIGGGVVDLVEPPAIRQREIDGDPRCERPIRAHIRLGVEHHHDGRAIIEMGVEVPPLVAALFGADTLAILELRHRDGSDAELLIIGGQARQAKLAVVVAGHDWAFVGWQDFEWECRLRNQRSRLPSPLK